MEIAAITTAYEGVKNLYGAVKAVLDAKEEMAIRARTAELLDLVTQTQGSLFEAQAQQSALTRRIHELEAQVVKLQDWAAESVRYRLHELMPGSFVYRIQPALQGDEPAHDLCAACYQEGVKSILQFAGIKSVHKYLVCSRCKAEVMMEPVEARAFVVKKSRSKWDTY